MGKKELDLNMFDLQLQEFLAGVHESIGRQTGPVAAHSLDLDRYLHEVNSFYYRSFKDRFMPRYVSSIQEEVSRLLELSRQEDMINTDILANLRRYARLYNYLKTLLNIQGDFAGEIDEHLLSLDHQLQKHLPRLFFALKALLYRLEELDQFTAGLVDLTGGKTLPGLLEQHPQCRKVFELLASLDYQDPVIIHGLNLMVEELQGSLHLLQELQSPGPGMSRFEALLRELKSSSDRLAGQNPVESITRFVNRYIMPDLHLYLTAMDLALTTGKAGVSVEMSIALKTILGRWFSVCNQGIELILSRRPELLATASLIEEGTPEYCRELHQDIVTTRHTIQSILDDWDHSQRGDFQEFKARIEQILEFAVPFFGKLALEPECRKIPVLAGMVHSVSLEFNHLAAQLVLLDDQHNHHVHAIERYQAMKNKLHVERERISGAKADLDRLLAPRNLSRSWKGLDVRVERIPLSRGDLFPADYLHLLEDFRVETQLLEGQKDPHVFYEEGDIFILSVGDKSEIEFPYLIVTQGV